MKKIISMFLIFIILLQLDTKPIKSFSDNSNLLGIKYTIWDDDYEEKDTITQIVYYGISFIIVGTISFLAMNSLKKSMGDTKPSKTDLQFITSIEDVAIEKIYTYFSNENISQLKEKLFLKFVDYKTSYMKYDYNRLQVICDTNLYNYIVNELNTLRQNGYSTYSHSFLLKASKIGDIHEEGNLIVTSIYLQLNYYNYVEDGNKNVIAGKKLEPIEECLKLDYIITKNKDNISCLNCGKKVFLEKNGNCPYCGATVTIDAPDYKLRSITKCE